MFDAASVVAGATHKLRLRSFIALRETAGVLRRIIDKNAIAMLPDRTCPSTEFWRSSSTTFD